MTAAITGWAHSKFGRSNLPDTESLIESVAQDAIDHAGLDASMIDAVVVGTMNNGFQAQDFQAALVATVIPELRHVPALRVENACATGSAAIHAGLNMIQAGRAQNVLVVGVEKMTGVDTATTGDILLGASYRKQESSVAGGFAGLFAKIADTYFSTYGDCSQSLARIAAKNHRNGAKNPYAHMQNDLGFAFCNDISEKNPYVAKPLRRTDCSLISDGAAALVLSSDFAGADQAIGFRAAIQVNDFLPLSRRNPIEFAGAKLAWQAALDQSRIDLDDLSFVETHDCFTIAELIEYEAMGLVEPGAGARAIDEGWTEVGGKLPVNPSGGLKSKGHPIGATGVSQHVMAAMQLTDSAAGMQIEDASLAGVFNMGGAAVANYVSILERVR